MTVDPQRHVTVADLGGGFDPDERPPRPSPDQIRGRGLYLARSFCPDMSWQRDPGGMVCTLVSVPVTGVQQTAAADDTWITRTRV